MKGSPSKSPPKPLRTKYTKQEAGSDEEIDSNLLNLTGSPLKDSCQFDLLNLSITDELMPKKNAWNDAEEKYHSISMDEAQYVTLCFAFVDFFYQISFGI